MSGLIELSDPIHMTLCHLCPAKWQIRIERRGSLARKVGNYPLSEPHRPATTSNTSDDDASVDGDNSDDANNRGSNDRANNVREQYYRHW